MRISTSLGEKEARTVASMTEQVLHQRNGFALLMLHAELRDEDDEAEPHSRARW